MNRALLLFLLLLCGCAHTLDRLSFHRIMKTYSGPPTFHWTPSVYTNLTYDVAVYEVVWLNQIWIAGKRVTYVQGVTNSTYTLTQALPPGEYCWGVRQREGEQVWPWRTQEDQATGLLIVPSHVKGSFARFRVRR